MLQNQMEKESSLIQSLATIDIHGAQFKKELEELAKLVNIVPHPNHLVTLLAVEKFIEQSIVNAVEPMETDGKDASDQGKSFALNRFDLGVRSSGNQKVDLAVRALRLIHVHRLRELQTQINELMVRIQKLTANPKADLKLGRVGF